MIAVWHIIIFILSCFLLSWSGSLLISSLTKVARFLGWREFVVAFFIMSFATSLPNLFVGITSALYKIPELSFGDVVGGNVIDLTVVIALATLVNRGLPADSKMVQASSIFTLIIAVAPLLLVADGQISRADGLLLILMFLLYTCWIFSKQERFTKTYEIAADKNKRQGSALKDVSIVIFGIILLLVGAKGVVVSAMYFASNFHMSLGLVGILIVGLGNCLPEMYFTLFAARMKEPWMVIGNLMGSVIVCATLVLGIVALIQPIVIIDFSPYALARIFLVLATLFFLVFIRTDRQLTKKEALFMLLLYIIFLICEILTK